MSAQYLGMVPQLLRTRVSGSRDDTLDIHLVRPEACWRDPRMDATHLAAAEERWKRSGLHSYGFIVTESYYGPGSDLPWLVTVTHDTVVSAKEVIAWSSQDSAPFGMTHVHRDAKHFADLTPPQLFKRLHRLVTDSNKNTAVTYDTQFGYPTALSEGVNCAYDAGGTIRIEHLRPRGY